MSKEKSIKQDKISIILKIFIFVFLSVIFAMAITGIVSLAFSVVLSKNELIGIIPVFSFLSLFLGCVGCGIFNAKVFDKDKIITSLISGVVLVLVLCIINIFSYNSDSTYLTVIKYLFCIICCVVSSLVVKNKKKTKRKH